MTTNASRGCTPARRQRRGFTLIEVLITVAVLAIVLALAVPMYKDYVLRAKRAEARRALVEAAQWLERNYTANGCYSRAAPAECPAQSGTALALPAGLRRAPGEGTASYALTVAFATDGQGFTLTAAPCGGGGDCSAFANDALVDAVCGSYTLDQTGARGITGSGTAATCWQK